MLRHVQQVSFGLTASTAVALNRFQQLVGFAYPQPEFVLFLTGQHGNVHFTGLVRVDVGDTVYDAGQRPGQQYVIEQIKYKSHRHGAQYAGQEDDQ